MPELSNGTEFLLVGGDPALDLLNTTPVLAAGPVDLLPDYAALTRWLAAAGLISAAQQAQWRRRWAAGREGARALAQVKRLRQDLLRILAAIKSGEAIRDHWLELVNALLQRGPVQLRIEWNADQGKFARGLSRDESGGASMAAVLVAEAIASLLTAKNLAHVRKCENPRCVLWFYDTSRNHTRRWCSMELCGNRAKVAAHYRRHGARGA
jgi:predicted RNA-binding Zn ribbon-like protein